MGSEERRAIDEFLETLSPHEEPSEHHGHAGPLGTTSYSVGNWPRFPATERSRVLRKIVEGRNDPHAVIGQLKREEFQSALNTTLDQLLRNFASWASQLSETRGKGSTNQRINGLEAQMKLLDARVARLEERQEMPVPLPDEGDPFDLLSQLKNEIGEERYRWFIKSE